MTRAVIHGLRNCDSCRKAMRWLDAHGVAYQFHDVRADGLGSVGLAGWIERAGWEPLLNRRSTTWRNLEATEREVDDAAGAIALLTGHPTLLRRPVLITGGELVIGFSAEKYAGLFSG